MTSGGIVPKISSSSDIFLLWGAAAVAAEAAAVAEATLAAVRAPDFFFHQLSLELGLSVNGGYLTFKLPPHNFKRSAHSALASSMTAPAEGAADVSGVEEAAA